MNSRHPVVLAALAFGLVVGCSDDGAPRRVVNVDAAADASVGDALSGLDVGPPDALVDAAGPDATSPDAAPLDAAAPDGMWLRPPRTAVEVRTTLAVASSTAGEGNRVTCEALDGDGDE